MVINSSQTIITQSIDYTNIELSLIDNYPKYVYNLYSYLFTFVLPIIEDTT